MINEKEMLGPLKTYLNNQGYTDFYEEVPLLSKRIDLVCSKSSKIIAIELKVKNWQRAFQQALTYRLGADKVYVALHHKFIHRVDKEKFSEFGIGLISVDSNRKVKMIQEARDSTSIMCDIRIRDSIQYYRLDNP